MYVIRETFTARPGKASSLAALLKKVMQQFQQAEVRVLTDYVGPMNTVVMETRVADLAAFDASMREYGARQDLRDAMKGYTDMYARGRREVWREV